jgi:hypothetical protein
MRIKLSRSQWENAGIKAGWIKNSKSQQIIKTASLKIIESHNQLLGFYKQAQTLTAQEVLTLTPSIDQAILDALAVYGYEDEFVIRNRETRIPLSQEQAKSSLASAISYAIKSSENKEQLDTISAYARANRRFALVIGVEDKKLTLSFNGIRMPGPVMSVLNAEIAKQNIVDFPRGGYVAPRGGHAGEGLKPRLQRRISDSSDAFEAISAAGYIAGNISLACILQRHNNVTSPQTGRLHNLWLDYGLGFHELESFRWLAVAIADHGLSQPNIMRKALTYFTNITGVDKEIEQNDTRTRAGFDMFLTKRDEVYNLATNLGVISDYVQMTEDAANQNVLFRRRANVLTMPLAEHEERIFDAVIGNTEIMQRITQEFGVNRGEAEEAAREAFDAGVAGHPNIQPDLHPAQT